VSASVIETNALQRRFGRTVAVADLSIVVGAGEIFGFLGPNGAGKTTSVKMLLGLVAPTAGRGHVLGAPLGNAGARARIGFLPEHFRFHDSLTATELLRFHGRLYGLRGSDLDARIRRLLTRVDLLDAADRPVRGYSKGMLQRVGLAQALLNDPELVFLDEPTSGLDPLGRLLVRGLIEELRAAGAAVFLNSHLLGEVEATCDRVVFVKRGRVVAERRLGAASSTLDLALRVRPVSDAALEGLSQFAASVQLTSDGGIVLQLADERGVPDIVCWLVAHGIEVHAVQPRRKSLEEVFVEVMGDDERPG
jgi:ABC-2 type transport system ATP-binding protein